MKNLIVFEILLLLSLRITAQEGNYVVPNDGHIPVGLMGNQSIWSDIFIKVVEESFGGNWK